MLSCFHAIDLIRHQARRRRAEKCSDRLADRRLRPPSIADEQMSALAMAVFFRGLSRRSCSAGRRAMINSGERLDFSRLSRPTADKHSTGGVGDKITLPLAPARRRLWGGSAAALRPRSRPHRRHAGQARVHPGLAGRV